MGAFFMLKNRKVVAAIAEREEQLKKEISDMAIELMADWPSSRNKQKQFILEYVATGFTNAAEAARNAGYSKNTARITANKMLTGTDKYLHIPPVVNQLKKAYQDRQAELKIADGVEILQRLTIIGRQEPMEKYYRSEKIVDGVKSVEENRYTTTPSDEDALRALDLLGKNYALWTEKVEHSGEIEQNHTMKNLTEDELRKLANMEED